MHLFNNVPLPKFQVSGLYILKPAPGNTYNNLPTNLVVLLKNGSRMLFY